MGSGCSRCQAGCSCRHPCPLGQGGGAPHYLVPLVGGRQLPVVGVGGQLPKTAVGQAGLGGAQLHLKAGAHPGAALPVHQGKSLGITGTEGRPDLQDGDMGECGLGTSGDSLGTAEGTLTVPRA